MLKTSSSNSIVVQYANAKLNFLFARESLNVMMLVGGLDVFSISINYFVFDLNECMSYHVGLKI